MSQNIATRLADGQVAASETVVYTAPLDQAIVIKRLSVTNVDTVERPLTYKLAFKQSDGSTGPSRAITKDLKLGPGEFLHDGDFQLEASDRIILGSDSASALDYVITGYRQNVS